MFAEIPNHIWTTIFAVLFFSVIIAAAIAIPLIIFYHRKNRYENTEYFFNTANSYSDITYDKGKNGEYTTYYYLSQLEGMKRFVFNCYIPKENGETTEIDVIMIHEKGIFVFESKNYSGWIFGSENDTYWTESVKNRKGKASKYKFYNPIKQNENHVKWLKKYLGFPQEVFFSYIVFSDLCSFKSINVNSPSSFVIKTSGIFGYVGNRLQYLNTVFTGEQIDEIYHKLAVHSMKNENEKAKHVFDIYQHRTSANRNKPNARDSANAHEGCQMSTEEYCELARGIVGEDFARIFKKQLITLSGDKDYNAGIELIHKSLPNNEFDGSMPMNQIIEIIVRDYDNALGNRDFPFVQEIKEEYRRLSGFDNFDIAIKIKLYFSARAMTEKKKQLKK